MGLGLLERGGLGFHRARSSREPEKPTRSAAGGQGFSPIREGRRRGAASFPWVGSARRRAGQIFPMTATPIEAVETVRASCCGLHKSQLSRAYTYTDRIVARFPCYRTADFVLWHANTCHRRPPSRTIRQQ